MSDSTKKKIEDFLNVIQDISENPSMSQDKKREQLDNLLLILSDYANFMNNIIKAKMIEIQSDETDVRYGNGALAEQVSDEFNTAIGHYTLSSNKDGDNNVAIGYASQHNNISGGGNVAVGSWALYSNENGHYNVVYGYSAGRKMEGNYNIAVGEESLFQVKGNNNLAIGITAGVNLKNGDKNIYIGSNRGNKSESNKLYIGNKKNGHSIIEGDMEQMELKFNAVKINMADLPSSDSGLKIGDLWNDNGVLKIKN
jgi:hypothetical protein